MTQSEPTPCPTETVAGWPAAAGGGPEDAAPAAEPRYAGWKPTASRVRQLQAAAVWVAYRLINAALRLFAVLLWPRRRPRSARRVVVFRIGHIGDITCALPALRAVRRAYPEAHLTLLTSTGRRNSPGARELLEGVDWIDEIRCYEAGDIATLGGRWRLAMDLRHRRFDVWLNLSASLSSPLREFRDMIFARLAGARWARGWHIDTLHWARQAQSEHLAFPNEVDRVLTIVDRAGFPAGPVEFALPRTAAAQARVNTLLPAGGATGWVALAPGAKRSTNRWPPERFAEVGAWLAARGARVVLLGGPVDAEECARIAATIGPSALSFAGQLTLPESCEVLRRCRFAICVDSGVQHLASAVGTPTISLFSFWQLRGKWHPYGARNVVLQKWVPCHTCFLDRCPHDNRCMKAIEVDEAIRHAMKKLAA